jgi:hypothetical protein
LSVLNCGEWMNGQRQGLSTTKLMVDIRNPVL